MLFLVLLGSVLAWDDHFEFDRDYEEIEDERIISFPHTSALAPETVNLADEKCK